MHSLRTISKSRLLALIAGVWMTIRGAADIWPTLTRKTVPEWVATWTFPRLPALTLGAAYGALSLGVGVAILITLWLQGRRLGGTATSGQQWEGDALKELQEDARRLRAMTPERDALRAALEETQADRERIRGLLDVAEQRTQQCRREFAEARLKWFAERAQANIANAARNGQIVPNVRATVRFAVYSDVDLAQSVAKILRDTTRWPVELDGSNKPTLLPDAEGFKVVFDVGPMQSFREVAWAFSEGALLGPEVKIGQRVPDARYDEMEHLIVNVLPSKP